MISQYSNDPDWHYSDEENFIEFKKRINEFLNFLSNRSEENILVVTHGGPLRMIILLMMLGRQIVPEIFYQFADFTWPDNTGITLCEENETGKYHLITWNDRSHLG